MGDPLIDRYEAGATKLNVAIAGLRRDQLLAKPIAGKWSIQQVVIHLADSDQILTSRMKRIIAEEKPTLMAFDENKFVQNLFYDAQSAEQAARILELNRGQFAIVLRLLPQAAFDRIGIHSERGDLTLQQLLEMTVNHLEHHLKFIVEKREKLAEQAG